MLLERPYFLKNKEWYTVNEGTPKFLGGTVTRRYSLTPNAPKEAISSHKEFYREIEHDGYYIKERE